VSDERELLGGVGACPPVIFKNYVAEDVIRRILGATKTRKDMSFFCQFCAIFKQVCCATIELQ